MCKAIFMITSRVNTFISFLHKHTRVYIKVLRLAMKVDEHKYYDGFLGAINVAFSALERFSMIFKRSTCVKTLYFSLNFSHFMALNKSFFNARNGRREKIVQCFHSFRAVDLPESNYTFQNPMTSLRNILAALSDMVVMVGVECRNLAVQRIHIPCHNLT
jgi:hypothetical protein